MHALVEGSRAMREPTRSCSAHVPRPALRRRLLLHFAAQIPACAVGSPCARGTRDVKERRAKDGGRPAERSKGGDLAQPGGGDMSAAGHPLALARAVLTGNLEIDATRASSAMARVGAEI